MFDVYWSWEPLDSLKILPQGAPTISPPGKPHSENFLFSMFSRPFLDEFLEQIRRTPGANSANSWSKFGEFLEQIRRIPQRIRRWSKFGKLVWIYEPAVWIYEPAVWIYKPAVWIYEPAVWIYKPAVSLGETLVIG